MSKETERTIKNLKISLSSLKGYSTDFLKERDKTRLQIAEACLDYLKHVRVLGETLDENDNAMQKEINLLEQEKANAEEARKYLSNDIRLNEERIRQLRCAVPDKDDDNIIKVDASPEKDAKNKNGNDSYDWRSVEGTWDWSFGKPGTTLESHGTVTFTKDGKMTWSGGSHGTWTQEGQTVTLTWEDKDADKDTMTLSADGHNLSGENKKAGLGVEGTRGMKK